MVEEFVLKCPMVLGKEVIEVRLQDAVDRLILKIGVTNVGRGVIMQGIAVAIAEAVVVGEVEDAAVAGMF